jgi:hypothetical protein
MPPAVAPEGDLVFWGKPSCPLTLLIRKSLHLYSQLGVGFVIYKNNLEILSKGRSDVVVGCSKRW